MKHFTTLIFILFCTNNIIAQKAFTGKAIEDYSKFRELIKSGKFDKDSVDSTLYDANLLEVYYNNKSSKETSTDNTVFPSGGINDIINPTMAIDAIGTFVANRIKEEANIAFLNRFTDFINDEKFLEASLLLPETKAKLGEIKNEIYDYKNYFPSLRNNFKIDFDNIPTNLVIALEDDKAFSNTALWGNFIAPNKPYLAFAVDVLDNFKKKQSVLDFLDNSRSRKYFNTLVNTKLSKTETQFVLFITDLAFHSISKNKSVTIEKLVKEGGVDKADVEAFLELLNASKKNNFKNFNKLNDVAKFSEVLVSLSSLSKLSTEKDKEKRNFNQYVDALDKLIYKIESTGIVSSNLFKTYVSPVSKIVKGITEKDYSLSVTGIINLSNGGVNSLTANNNELNKLRKYLTFMANVVNAKDGSDMLAALNAAALPVGSYAMKRASVFTASIGALGGLGLSDDWKTSIYAPVGFNFAFGGKKLKGNGIQLTVPLIDVGAVTAIRLIGNQDALPALTWENVFAPGIIASWGIKNSPLTLSAGYQKGPGLIKIESTKTGTTTTNTATIESRTYRFGMSLAFDIPIFKIYQK